MGLLDDLKQSAAPPEQEQSFLSKLGHYAVNDSIPAQAVQGFLSGLTLPGDVYAGKADPYDIGRALDFAGAITLGAGAIPAGADEMRMGVKLMGGGEAPPTQTGWTFRDVKKPVLSPYENRRYSDGSTVPRVETVPIRKLYATQDSVNPDFDVTETSSGLLPSVIRKNGEMFVMDGHHRLTKLAEEGGNNARVNFHDMDSPETADTPLLKWTPEGHAAKLQKSAKELDEINELLKELGML